MAPAIGNGVDVTTLCYRMQHSNLCSCSLKSLRGLPFPGSHADMIMIWHRARAGLLADVVPRVPLEVGTPSPRLCCTSNHTNLFSVDTQEDSTSQTPRKPVWPVIIAHLACVPFLDAVSLRQMSGLASLEMGPLWTWKAVSFPNADSPSQKNTQCSGTCQMCGNMGSFPAVRKQ